MKNVAFHSHSSSSIECFFPLFYWFFPLLKEDTVCIENEISHNQFYGFSVLLNSEKIYIYTYKDKQKVCLLIVLWFLGFVLKKS